jgi:hypothetical protein
MKVIKSLSRILTLTLTLTLALTLTLTPCHVHPKMNLSKFMVERIVESGGIFCLVFVLSRLPCCLVLSCPFFCCHVSSSSWSSCLVLSCFVGKGQGQGQGQGQGFDYTYPHYPPTGFGKLFAVSSWGNLSFPLLFSSLDFTSLLLFCLVLF